MHQSQLSPDQKTISTINTFVVEIPKSIDSVDQKQQHNNGQNSRLDKALIKFSSWKMLVQIILMTPSFIVPIYFGVHYANLCLIQPLINVFMIVHGCVSFANVMLLLIGFISATYIKRSASSSPHARRLFIGSLIGQLVVLIFSIAWLVPGLIWIFGAKSNGFQSKDPTQSTTYCPATLFWNAFAMIFITIGLYSILIFLVAGIFIVKRYKAKRKTVLSFDTKM
ncbi:unnamed protein product [Adineta steineri]|uniref:Uncharacterized protein n=1 Tax=Adineta steineri TaxID=433720 RepID=A0A813WUH1_9BILA|nr:unnamed protein product [Adineta steineri]CAF1220828.1 unnamed protein product [Adineta steineri]